MQHKHFHVFRSGNTGELPQDATAASPDLRNGLVVLNCAAAWVTPADDEDVISGLVQYANNRMYQYGTGAYYNENDYYLQNWQVVICIILECISRFMEASHFIRSALSHTLLTLLSF